MVQYTQVAPVIYGAGSVSVVGERAKGLGCSKVLIVSGKSVRNNGTLDKITQSLSDNGIEYVCFDEVETDAPDYVCNKGGQLAQDEKVDGMIAVGGGSALDTAKAINILATNEGPVSKWYGNPLYEKPVPLICIPTTSGTGSESTRVAVIYDTENNYKSAVIRGCELAILDPELTLTVPKAFTAACALDAFAHSLEAATSSHTNPKSDVLACDAISKIVKYLPIAYADGSDLEARSQLLIASNFAGMAFADGGVHVGHAIAHSFGVAFHMPHGEGCALTLSAVMKLAAKAVPDKFLAVAAAMGCESDDTEEALSFALAKIKEFLTTTGIKGLKERGISLEDAVACADYAIREGFVATSAPAKITIDDMKGLIEEIYAF